MRAIMAGLLLVGLAGQACAGAWPRQKGETFVSISQTFSTEAKILLAPTENLDSYTALYAEYGLTERLTVGLDGAYALGPGSKLRTGLIFARYPVWSNESGSRVAVDLGFGYRRGNDGEQGPRLRAGLSWGRGLESRWGPGWLGFETSVEAQPPTDDRIYKADFTLGWKPREDWMAILQVQTGFYPHAEPLVRIAPSIVKAFGAHSNLELGIVSSVYGDESIGVKIATWIRF